MSSLANSACRYSSPAYAAAWRPFLPSPRMALARSASTRPQHEQGAHEQIHRDGRVAGLHFGDAGLAGLKALGEFDLRDPASLPPVAKAAAQGRVSIR